jgi:hypothetical protein
MAQGELGNRFNIFFAYPLRTAPGRVGPGGTQPDEISAQAIDAGSEAALSDFAQGLVIQRNAGQYTPGLLTTLAQGMLGGFPFGAKRRGIMIKRQAPANDFAAFGGYSMATESNVQAEAIEQLRTQLAFFRVHGANQDKFRRMPMGDAIAFYQVDAAGRHVEQQVHQVIGQQVDFIDIQYAAVGLGQDPWRKSRAAFVQCRIKI